MATPGIFKLQGLMTTTEAAATVGVHRNTVWNAIKQGHIPAHKIGNAIALDPRDVAEFRGRYLRGEVTSTALEPKKRGRPRGSTKTVATPDMGGELVFAEFNGMACQEEQTDEMEELEELQELEESVHTRWASVLEKLADLGPEDVAVVPMCATGD